MSQNTRTIPLEPDGEALVDEEDYGFLSRFRWRRHTGGYAVRLVRDNYYQHVIYMHRLILLAPDGREVDHRNGNRLDNRKSNIRLASRQQNNWNQTGDPRASTGYRGVYRTRPLADGRVRWRASLSHNGVSRHLGTFDTIHEAAQAYDAEAKRLRGEFARLNFPED